MYVYLHNSGLLGPTHWYYRHRDEKAQNRILSIPRKKGARLPIPEKNTVENNNSDISKKIQLLKTKLEEKNRIKSPELENSEDSKTKTNFSNFMAKVN
jgi:hypothetical protein